MKNYIPKNVNYSKKKIIWDFDQSVKLLKWKKVHTVCEESRCPNRYECSQQGIATYLIGGDTCTRACKFCHIKTGRPMKSLKEIAKAETEDILNSVTQLDSRYVVITSVARDDEEYELAHHFARITQKLNHKKIKVELLIPDFHLKPENLQIIGRAAPLVLGHNIETVQRLSRSVRPQSDYERSLKLYEYFHKYFPGLILKAGMMVGLGENLIEIRKTLEDLRKRHVEIVTIGQYMRPSSKQLEVKSNLAHLDFQKIESLCKELGFPGYEVGPFVRSSYMASRTMQKVFENRKKQ